jgi:hypothetical protein
MPKELIPRVKEKARRSKLMRRPLFWALVAAAGVAALSSAS